MERKRYLNSIEIGKIRVVSESESISKLVKIADMLYSKHKISMQQEKMEHLSMYG